MCHGTSTVSPAWGGLMGLFPNAPPLCTLFPSFLPPSPLYPQPNPGTSWSWGQLSELSALHPAPLQPCTAGASFPPRALPPPYHSPPRCLAPAAGTCGAAPWHGTAARAWAQHRGAPPGWGGCEGGERGHRAPLYFPFFFFIVLNFQFLLILRLSLFCFFPVQRILPSSSPTWGT